MSSHSVFLAPKLRYKNLSVLMQRCVCLQRGSRKKHAVPGSTDDEEPGKAREPASH